MLAGRASSVSTNSSSRAPTTRQFLTASGSNSTRLAQQVRPRCTQPTPNDVPAEIRKVIQGRSVSDVEEDIVVAECQLVHEFLASTGRLPASCSNAVQLASVMRQLTDVAATGADFRTLQMLKRHPGLLEVDGHELAQRVLHLKLLLPRSNIADLIYQRPSLLLLSTERAKAAIVPALAKLRALMPGIPVEQKLHEGGTVFWSFASMLPDASGSSTSKVEQRAA